jgi:hypothetical protein
MMNRFRLLIASLCLIASSGCAGANSTTAATATTAARTTDTFSGAVAVGGSDVHSFSVAVAGTVDVTLTAVTPAIVMGIAVGSAANGGCAPLAGGSTQAAAGSAAQLSGVVTPGTLCVDVHDAGFQSTSVSYTVTVTHP